MEEMALEGVRVLDFTRLGFGPQATLILGCLGAEVIRVESSRHPDGVRVIPPLIPVAGEKGEGFGGASLAAAAAAGSFNRGGTFYKYNTGGKKSITIDARHPEGLAVLKRLVAVSDVVTESFAAGTLARWGLGYDVLKSVKPDVIYVSMCGFGHAGPDASHVTMGPTAQALTGLTALVGLPDRPPAGWSFSYLDHVGGYLGAVAVLHALLYRRRTGEGQHVDVTQLEPATVLAGPLLLDYLVNGRPTRRPGFPPGNRRLHPPGAPQGAYRCRGEDQWVVISCTTDGHWDGLVKALGHPAWAAELAAPDARLARLDALDTWVEEWTRQQDKYEAMHHLQAHGVPAGAVQDAADRLERDPQLAARRHFTRLSSTEVGELPLEGVPFRMSATPPHTGGRIRRGPPDLGEDTEAVLGDLLGMGTSELDRLRASGVLA
jgi:crotonobetainyl-CoA:carnitine CoA-transferase CaiB-like acyl-CoA transferase